MQERHDPRPAGLVDQGHLVGTSVLGGRGEDEGEGRGARALTDDPRHAWVVGVRARFGGAPLLTFT